MYFEVEDNKKIGIDMAKDTMSKIKEKFKMKSLYTRKRELEEADGAGVHRKKHCHGLGFCPICEIEHIISDLEALIVELKAKYPHQYKYHITFSSILSGVSERLCKGTACPFCIFEDLLGSEEE